MRTTTILLLLTACTSDSLTRACPVEGDDSRAYIVGPTEDADVAAYQCNGYGADCVEVDAATDDRGVWYVSCSEPTDYRPLLVVDWTR